ncbi:MAG: hypothetical protein ACLGIV_01995 [Actinomycetes bacterium]
MPEIDWGSVRVEIDRKFADWQVLPVVPRWSRLEPLPLTRGDLTPGAQALLGDPLWLLGRQWQYDELRGEDAGTPVLATVEGETAPLSRLRPGDDGTVVPMAPGEPDDVPLEVRVEAEVPAVLPVRVRTQLGLHLLRLLRAGGHGAVADAAVAAYPFPAPDADADPAGARRLRLAAGRVPDGAAVLSALTDDDLPAPLADAAGMAADDVRGVLAGWRAWGAGLLAAPSDSSWDPHRLEHRFAVQADLTDGPVVVDVDDYTGGTLDWFHGEGRSGPSLGGSGTAVAAQRVSDTNLPSAVRFAGMPSDRLFAFEDSAVYLGGVQGGRTDLARLAVVEFALAYGVDWFQLPLDLPYGSVTRLDRIEVRDTFGHRVDIAPARETTRPGWAAFQSTAASDASRLNRVFVLAPTLQHVLEGEPLEEVALFRDEMANLVWGVERVVPDATSGEPVPVGRLAAPVRLVGAAPDDLGDARVVWRLMTPVPENWIPMVAVRQRPGDLTAPHVLERRPLLRYLDVPAGETQPRVDLVHPRGTVLLSRPDADPATDRLRVAEEEVPRDGVVVTRSFQLARTVGGGTSLWVGRRVRVGHGEGASGLRFDTADPPGGGV